MTCLNPVYTCGDQIAEVVSRHKAVSRREAWARAVEMLGPGRHPGPGAGAPASTRTSCRAACASAS